MKKIVCTVFLLIFLFGCGREQTQMDPVLQLRDQLENSPCSFTALVTADYGDAIYQFSLDCVYTESGDLQFQVLTPETISGICGQVAAEGGKLQFEDVFLGFSLLADGQISPVSAPWVIMRALTAGYITSVGVDGQYLRATIQDSYAADAFTVDFWLEDKLIPVQADIIWKNRRILSVRIKDFQME